MEESDYYSILQVDPAATEEQVRSAYKRLALIWHPDLSVHPEANRRMQLINEAYGILGSQEKRAEYDRLRRVPVVETPAPAPAAAAPEPVGNSPPSRPATGNAPPAAAVPPIDLEKQKALERQWKAWLKKQLKLVGFSILYTLILFIWTLISGELSFLVILLLLVPVAVVFVMLFRWLRRPVQRRR